MRSDLICMWQILESYSISNRSFREKSEKSTVLLYQPRSSGVEDPRGAGQALTQVAHHLSIGVPSPVRVCPLRSDASPSFYQAEGRNPGKKGWGVVFISLLQLWVTTHTHVDLPSHANPPSGFRPFGLRCVKWFSSGSS